MAKPNKTAPKPPVRRRLIITSEAQAAASLQQQREAKRAQEKERFLEILDEHLGVISYAAVQAGIPRRTIYEWLDADPEFQRRVKEIDHKQLDFVERKLLENIRTNDTRAITFYLSTKGRHRGYTTRVEFTTPQDQPLKAEVSFDCDEARNEMSDAALAKAMKSVMRANPNAFPSAAKIAIVNGAIDRK